MLDLYSVKSQVDGMVAHRVAAPRETEGRLARALEQLQRWGGSGDGGGPWRDLADLVACSAKGWLLPRIIAPLTTTVGPVAAPSRLSVAATDGSQIFPDRHEISPCYLINIGHVLLHYGTGERPLLATNPRLFYKDSDLFQTYGDRRVAVSRDLVGIRRSLLEMIDLKLLAVASHDEGHQTVAMSDGSLIAWDLEGRPHGFRQAYLKEMLVCLDELRQRGIPLIGYISRPGSNEVINALRVGMCPTPARQCDCADRNAIDSYDGRSCTQIEGLSDALLMKRVLLNPGERSAVFASTSPILEEYGDHGVCFFYLNIGTEVVRIEIPRWVAEDESMLGLVHSGVWDQVGKGAGYPVGLTEAHERAVVRGRDREAFFRCLKQSLVRNGLEVSLSRKGKSKLQPRV